MLLVCLLGVLPIVLAQNASPCPSIFAYEPRGSQTDRWYGGINLESPKRLEGIWLRIVLDRPAELLGNWFGDASSEDNQDFLVKNRTYRLQPGMPLSVRFFIKYNTASIIPSLKAIRLNGVDVCSADNSVETTTQELKVSVFRPATTESNLNQQSVTPVRRPVSAPSQFSNNNERERPNTGTQFQNGQRPRPITESVFLGDFGNANGPLSNNNNVPNLRPTPTRHTCGTVGIKASPLIAKGQPTIKGQWPWHAAFFHTKQGQQSYTCGGTLISESHVLTAAHCVAYQQSARPVNPKNLLVYLGKYSLKKFDGTQEREISNIYIHPEYNSSMYFNDVAVVKFDQPIEMTNLIRPCCLWEGNTNIETIFNQIGTVVGFGYDENHELTDNLMQAQMPIIPTVQCIYSNRDFFSQFTFEKNYCAGFKNGTTVCNGDSGGGMFFPRSGTNGQTVWQVRGLVSVGVALQGHGVCDPTQFTVFTDLAKYLDWIKRTIEL